MNGVMSLHMQMAAQAGQAPRSLLPGPPMGMMNRPGVLPMPLMPYGGVPFGMMPPVMGLPLGGMTGPSPYGLPPTQSPLGGLVSSPPPASPFTVHSPPTSSPGGAHVSPRYVLVANAMAGSVSASHAASLASVTAAPVRTVSSYAPLQSDAGSGAAAGGGGSGAVPLAAQSLPVGAGGASGGVATPGVGDSLLSPSLTMQSSSSAASMAFGSPSSARPPPSLFSPMAIGASLDGALLSAGPGQQSRHSSDDWCRSPMPSSVSAVLQDALPSFTDLPTSVDFGISGDGMAHIGGVRALSDLAYGPGLADGMSDFRTPFGAHLHDAGAVYGSSRTRSMLETLVSPLVDSSSLSSFDGFGLAGGGGGGGATDGLEPAGDFSLLMTRSADHYDSTSFGDELAKLTAMSVGAGDGLPVVPSMDPLQRAPGRLGAPLVRAVQRQGGAGGGGAGEPSLPPGVLTSDGNIRMGGLSSMSGWAPSPGLYSGTAGGGPPGSHRHSHDPMTAYPHLGQMPPQQRQHDNVGFPAFGQSLLFGGLDVGAGAAPASGLDDAGLGADAFFDFSSGLVLEEELEK